MDFNEITDIHLCVNTPDESLLFPGPYRVSPEMNEMVFSLINLCQAQVSSGVQDDFMVTYGDFRFRGRHAQRAIDGVWFRLRKMESRAPEINELPSPMKPVVADLVMSSKIERGGLIYVVGAPGSGKTTTASSILVSRLKKFGGFAYTIEDPPEMSLNGWHTNSVNDDDLPWGYCTQNVTKAGSDDPWGEAIQEALRSQPAGSRSILYIGEVRDSRCARAMLRAASNGFLVIATGFGQDITNGLDSLVRLATRDGNDDDAVLNDVANNLKMVIHQKLEYGQIIQEFLMSSHASSEVANSIRQNAIGRLKGEIERQKANATNMSATNKHTDAINLSFK